MFYSRVDVKISASNEPWVMQNVCNAARRIAKKVIRSLPSLRSVALTTLGLYIVPSIFSWADSIQTQAEEAFAEQMALEGSLSVTDIITGLLGLATLAQLTSPTEWSIFSPAKKVTFSPVNEYRFYFLGDPPNVQYSAWTGKRV